VVCCQVAFADDHHVLRVRTQAAARRKAAVLRYLWDPAHGVYTDYLWREGMPSGKVTAASLYPLFFGLATKHHADRVAKVVQAQLLKPGGIVTTTIESGEQWDSPNGWAPLQWIAVEGLADYGESDLANTIASRWMNNVVAAYRRTGKLMEKYNVVDPAQAGGGGEYPGQDGFGWTNGVLRKMLVLDRGGVAGVRCAREAAE